MSEEAATWHMVKYLPDLRRREPRNVGLIIETPVGWLTKFVGEAENGEINGNRIKGTLDLEVYKTWVDYFRRKALSEQWDDVERLQKKRPTPYFAELGGVVYDAEGRSWQELLDSMFTELVNDQTEKVSQSTRAYLLEQARTTLRIANIQVEERVKVNARFGDRTSLVPFEFRHLNGRSRLMDAVNIGGHDPDGRARELRARIVAARAAEASADFFTFYIRGERTTQQLDDVLMPIESESQAIDVTEPGNAADRVAELLAV